MKTIVEALQDLYVALGGKAEDVSGLKLNPDVIEQIAELAKEGGIGGGLPEVTPEDAGDVLTVSAEGEWEAAAPGGGGGGITLIPLLLDDQTGNPYLDKTWSEIYTAMSTTGGMVKDPDDQLSSIQLIYHDLDSGLYYVEVAGGLQFSAAQQSDKPVIAGT